MWIRSVTAHAFGAIEGHTLKFGDELNIVVGLNGTGKSTWHAAIYAALTGIPGDPVAPVDRRLHRRHPRSGRAWSVSTEIELADGRVVRLSQGRDARTAVGAGDEADLAPAIRYEGGLDATRWLGLDRRYFAATAYVEQAYGLLASSEDTTSQALQRAIASGGGGTTVGEALARIERHSRHVVGDPSDPGSPIGRALTTVQQAKAAEDEYADLRQRQHVQQSEVARADQEVVRAQADLTAGQVVAARAAVVELQARLDEAMQAEREHAEAVARAAGRPVIDPRVEEAAARYRSALSSPSQPVPSPPASTPPASTRPAISPPEWVAPTGSVAGHARPTPNWWVPVVMGLASVAGLIGSAVASNPAGFVISALLLLGSAGLAVRAVLRRRPVRVEPVPETVPPVPVPESPVESEPAVDLVDRCRAELQRALAGAGLDVAVGEEVWTAVERYRRDAVPPVPEYAGPSVSEAEVRLEGARRQLDALQPPQASGSLYGPPVGPGYGSAGYGSAGYTTTGYSSTGYSSTGYSSTGYGRIEPEPRPTADLPTLLSRYEGAKAAHSDASAHLIRIGEQMSALTVDSAGLAAARAEYDRLRQLEAIFHAAATRLDSARASVHRSVAERLAFRVQEWLADVTNGRYTSVRIDPDTLTVYIAGPDDPEVDSDEDSQGAADVVRLLLRLALYLRERDGEAGPLLLDDVLTHSDPLRAKRTVEVLAKIARRDHHQVILFATQEVDGFPATVRLESTRAAPNPSPQVTP